MQLDLDQALLVNIYEEDTAQEIIDNLMMNKKIKLDSSNVLKIMKVIKAHTNK